METKLPDCRPRFADRGGGGRKTDEMTTVLLNYLKGVDAEVAK